MGYTKTLYLTATVDEVKDRLGRLRPESARQWGKMNAAQMVAHCSIGMELALGDFRPPRMVIGRVIGGLIKPIAFKEAEPIRRDSPTIPGMVVADARDLDLERVRLYGLIDRFAEGGPAGCTTHPHSFFGRLTAEEWSMWMYKHLDHHLQQFGV